MASQLHTAAITVVLLRWFHWYTTGTNDVLNCELILKAFSNFFEITLKSLLNLKAGFVAFFFKGNTMVSFLCLNKQGF